MPTDQLQYVVAERTVSLKRNLAKSNQICPQCWFPSPSLCICPLIFPKNPNHSSLNEDPPSSSIERATKFQLKHMKLHIFMHFKEYLNSSNTAKLLVALLEPSELYIYSYSPDEVRLFSFLKENVPHFFNYQSLQEKKEGQIDVQQDSPNQQTKNFHFDFENSNCKTCERIQKEKNQSFEFQENDESLFSLFDEEVSSQSIPDPPLSSSSDSLSPSNSSKEPLPPVFILFPSEDSITIEEALSRVSLPQNDSADSEKQPTYHIIILDGTWSHARTFNRLFPPCIPRVRLSSEALARLSPSPSPSSSPSSSRSSSPTSSSPSSPARSPPSSHSSDSSTNKSNPPVARSLFLLRTQTTPSRVSTLEATTLLLRTIESTIHSNQERLKGELQKDEKQTNEFEEEKVYESLMKAMRHHVNVGLAFQSKPAPFVTEWSEFKKFKDAQKIDLFEYAKKKNLQNLERRKI